MYQTPSYIVNLGKRIAAGLGSEKDLEELESFCQAFSPAYKHVFDEVVKLGYRPTGRFPKSTASIRAKIRRERTRLTSMQDIAGIRIVVPNIAEQDAATNRMRGIATSTVRDHNFQRG